MEKVINPLKEQNISNAGMPENDNARFGSNVVRDMKELQVGVGVNVFRADRSGIWLGASKFENAPFRVSMTGEIYATGLTLSSLSGTLDDIDDGTTYKKAIQTQLDGGSYAYSGLNSTGEIIKGFLNTQLSSKTLPTNGVRIDNSGIYGRQGGSTTFYISSAGDAYFSGDIYASDITGGTITGASFYVKNGSTTIAALDSGGIKIYGQELKLYDEGGSNLYGYIGGYGGYYNITTNNRNILIDAGYYTVHLKSTMAPLVNGDVNLGYYNYAFGNVYSFNFSFNSYAYLSYNGSQIQSNSDFRVAGSIRLTGNLIFENNASITIDGTAFYVTPDPDSPGSYYLRS